MAIYHLHVKVIGRKAGSSAVASAAYRSASRLRDDRLGRDQNFSAKRGVVHSEVMLPQKAPPAWSDRERLWNDVEASEARRDAQLAREVEFALPREMTERQGVELARAFVQSEFVDPRAQPDAWREPVALWPPQAIRPFRIPARRAPVSACAPPRRYIGRWSIPPAARSPCTDTGTI